MIPCSRKFSKGAIKQVSYPLQQMHENFLNKPADIDFIS